MLGRLIPNGGGEEIPLLKPKLLVGRRDSCDICLQFSNVSSRHCELEFINGYWQVTDLNSANGTKINGTRVDQKWLMPGDEIGFAKHFFTISYTPLGDAPQPKEAPEKMQSLLEKAGLARGDDEARPRRGKPAAPNQPAATGDSAAAADRQDDPSPSKPAPPARKSEEDRALEWLMGGD